MYLKQKVQSMKNVFIEFLSGFSLRMKQDIVTGSHLYSRQVYYDNT